ncbi:MAG TPA: DUF2993 domain-containing protein, partial [Actinomycetota bacterium]|nr:DUF2993 domain-containing protein [Actinomycetota bacterium]
MARPARTAGILLVVVLALAVGGDFAARIWAENVLAGRLRTELALSERPDVDIGGWPFLLGLARRRFPTATVEAQGLRAQDVDVRSVHLELRDVRFSTAGGVVRAGSGTGEVELHDTEVSSYIQSQGLPLTVTFLGPQVVVSTSLDL